MHEIFQVFDKGWMEDGEGRYIDFKNTIIILTTNVGTDLIMDMCDDPEMLPTPEGLTKALRAPMLKTFPCRTTRPHAGDSPTIRYLTICSQKLWNCN